MGGGWGKGCRLAQRLRRDWLSKNSMRAALAPHLLDLRHAAVRVRGGALAAARDERSKAQHQQHAADDDANASKAGGPPNLATGQRRRI